jgi:hypothetical protein
MKKLFFFAAFLCAASLTTTVNAQCTGAKTASTKTACCAKTKAAMAKAVSADSSIEKKVCSVTGKETFYRNYTCEDTGKMTSTEVTYDEKQGTFVNVSPTRGAQPAAEATATDAKKKSCAASCTKGKKACGAKSTKQASTSTKAMAPAKAQLTKGENK